MAAAALRVAVDCSLAVGLQVAGCSWGAGLQGAETRPQEGVTAAALEGRAAAPAAGTRRQGPAG